MTYARKLGLDFSWHRQAACNSANRPDDVRSEWFAELSYRPVGRAADEPLVRKALAVCRHCPVIRECATQAMLDRGARGVWGGRYIRGSGD